MLDPQQNTLKEEPETKDLLVKTRIKLRNKERCGRHKTWSALLIPIDINSSMATDHMRSPLNSILAT